MQFWRVLTLGRQWHQHRALLSCLIARNLKIRFGGVKDRSWLGILLSQINPVAIIAVYAIVSGGILKVRVENFLIYLAVGHLHWTLFTSVMSVGCNTIKKEAGLIKVVVFPYSLLVVADVLDELFEPGVTLLLLLLLIPVLGGSYGLGLLLYPVVLLMQIFFMTGLAAAFAALTPFFNDIVRLQALAIRLMFWFTPVIYTATMVPERFRTLFIYLNPMSLFLSVYRELLCFGTWPSWQSWVGLTFWTVLGYVGGWLIFCRLERQLPEEL